MLVIIEEMNPQTLDQITKKEDFNRICRCCLSNGNMFSLSTVTMFSEIIKWLFDTQADLDDQMPQDFCETCVKEITQIYNFKTMCADSTKALQAAIGEWSTKKTHEPVLATAEIKTDDSTFIEDDIVQTEDVQTEIDNTFLSSSRDTFQQEDSDRSYSNKSITEDNCSDNTENCPKKSKPTDLKEPLEKIFKCSICSAKFDNLTQLKNHMITTHNGKIICGERFKRLMTLKMNRMMHTTKKLTNKTESFSCKPCQKSFATVHGLNYHLLRHGERRFLCNVCGKSFYTHFLLKAHSRIHTGEKPHTCDICSKKFTMAQTLHNHKLVHTKTKRYVCNLCPKAFTQSQHLTNHRRIHTGERPYSCKLCPKTYRDKYRLTLHVRTHTGEKPFACDQCPKRFSQRPSLKTHMLKHTGDKPFVCNICSKGYTQKQGLKKHLPSHTGKQTPRERLYMCDKCPKKFAFKGGLDRHMLMHTGTKPHVCHICAKAFTQNEHLINHLRVHTGEKPYVCSYCDKAFAHSANFNAHVRIHTRTKPHMCDQCPKGFNSTSGLKRHKKQHLAEKAKGTNLVTDEN